MPTSSPSRLRGDLWAVSSALTTGSGLIAAKMALKSISPITFNAYIFFVGAVILLIDAAVSRKLRETIHVTPRQVGFLIIISVLFCGGTFCLYTAVSLIEPATVSFLSRLELVATLILATIFLRERINLAEFSGLILVVAGLIVMRYDASLALSKAVALVAGGSLLTGGAEVLIKSKIFWINYRSLILYRNVFITVIFLIVGTSIGRFTFVTETQLFPILIVAGLFLPYMGRLSYLKAMQNINVSRASIITQSQPFFAAVVALLVLGTFPAIKEIIGGLLIVAGVITIKVIERRTARHNVLARP
jgi:drug/metabolite transporter (DMT)-like permease